MNYDTAIKARRAFRLNGFHTLAHEGFDGDYVSPIQISSGNLTGPMLISKDWLDVPSVRANKEELERVGYLASIKYNKVIDLALEAVNLRRSDIYISPIFHLLVNGRSSPIPASGARASFDLVGRHELLGRRPIALGIDAAATLDYFNVPHIKVVHPSARKFTYAQKAEIIAEAIIAQ